MFPQVVFGEDVCQDLVVMVRQVSKGTRAYSLYSWKEACIAHYGILPRRILRDEHELIMLFLLYNTDGTKLLLISSAGPLSPSISTFAFILHNTFPVPMRSYGSYASNSFAPVIRPTYVLLTDMIDSTDRYFTDTSLHRRFSRTPVRFVDEFRQLYLLEGEN